MKAKYFHTKKKVTRTEVVPFTEEELHKLLFNELPTFVFNGQWSTKTPFLVITGYNKHGFLLYCNSWADKTPKQYDAKKLYDFLKYQGLDNCYIK